MKQIWHEPQQHSIRDSSIYRKLLPKHIVQQLLHYGTNAPSASAETAHRPAGAVGADAELGHGSGFSPITTPGGGVERQPPHSAPAGNSSASIGGGPNVVLHPAAQGLLSSLTMDQDSVKHYHDEEEDEEHGGHDSPNWSKAKSATVLLGCTVLYSIIAGKTNSFFLDVFRVVNTVLL